ncbi:MAG TPA: multiprotein bridging factor aMBF1 [Candidatus Nanoarchaeia archaeon]|nr:multiprotein bridging factor aMBF1 [Candidatus Nanoarchaeia archaeon]
MRCEMCGAEKELFDALVEGVMLSVCENCSSYGKVVKIAEKVKFEKPKKKLLDEEFKEFIVEDYSKKIKEARERLGLKQEELAKRIAEKESVIHSLETGSLEPSLDLAKKLERALGIKLIDIETEFKEEKKVDFSAKNITIGDLIKLKKDE